MSLKPSTRKGPGVLGMAWQANELFIFLVVELVVVGDLEFRCFVVFMFKDDEM